MHGIECCLDPLLIWLFVSSSACIVPVSCTAVTTMHRAPRCCAYASDVACRPRSAGEGLRASSSRSLPASPASPAGTASGMQRTRSARHLSHDAASSPGSPKGTSLYSDRWARKTISLVHLGVVEGAAGLGPVSHSRHRHRLRLNKYLIKYLPQANLTARRAPSAEVRLPWLHFSTLQCSFSIPPSSFSHQGPMHGALPPPSAAAASGCMHGLKHVLCYGSRRAMVPELLSKMADAKGTLAARQQEMSHLSAHLRTHLDPTDAVSIPS